MHLRCKPRTGIGFAPLALTPVAPLFRAFDTRPRTRIQPAAPRHRNGCVLEPGFGVDGRQVNQWDGADLGSLGGEITHQYSRLNPAPRRSRP